MQSLNKQLRVGEIIKLVILRNLLGISPSRDASFSLRFLIMQKISSGIVPIRTNEKGTLFVRMWHSTSGILEARFFPMLVKKLLNSFDIWDESVLISPVY